MASWTLGQSWSYTIHGSAAFSSPRAHDLNGDHYPDVVLGTGNENRLAQEGILALDGRSGQKLWNYPATNQLFSSAVFADVTLDGIPEVFLGGRKALFYCLDGSTGDLVWQFDPSPFGHTHDSLRFNLYTPVLVPDQNQDGYPDLVNVYGGGSTANSPSRPPGWLLLLSGKTGEVLARDTMPDGRESYSSPLVYDLSSDGDPEILFGSGEERRGGSLYQCTLSELANSDIQLSRPLFTDSLKGIIAVSSLADLNGDGDPEIACPALNEQLIVIDGKTGSQIFHHREPGYEHYASPVIGQFTGDATPDILCVFQQGSWPFYSSYKFVLIDGGLQAAVWDTLFPLYQLTQHVALDADKDGYDELLFCANKDTGFTTVEYTHSLILYDFQHRSSRTLIPPQKGINIFSTPLLSDFQF